MIDSPSDDPLDQPANPILGQYILDENGEPVPAKTLREWAEWLEVPGRRILQQDTVGERLWVSTVFLGLDQNHFRSGPPILWETMIFWNKVERREWPDGHEFFYHPEWNGYQQRYRSRDDALKGHRRAVALAERALQELDAKSDAEKPK